MNDLQVSIAKVERQLERMVKIIYYVKCGEYYERCNESGPLTKLLEKYGIYAHCTMP